MKVYIITQDEPFFVPKMISKISKEATIKGFVLAGVSVLKPYRKNKSFSHWIKERAKIYTFMELIIVAFAFVMAKCLIFIRKSDSPYSVSGICRKNNISLIRTTDINSPEFITLIKKMEIDLLISISCPQLFRTELLSAPKNACINAHGTLLPKHRGVFGSWWMLYQNDAVGGSTIHTMVPEVDKGDILWQREFAITQEHTQYRIAHQTKKDMSEGIVEVISQYKNKSVTAILSRHPSSYHYAPDEKMGKEFHKRGKKILVLKDLKFMLSKEFSFHGS